MKAVAQSALGPLLENYQAESAPGLIPAQYSRRKGFEAGLSGVAGEPREVHVFIARNDKGCVMTLCVFTLPVKMVHIMPAVERIREYIRFKKR